jgi:hypothetical protein
MTFYADPRQDLPAPHKQKRIIFYADGLKVYGAIPYVLQRRLKAKFYSNNAPGLFGGRLIAPTMESNYTVVPYQARHDVIEKLLNWLYADAGFKWGIAKDFHASIEGWNAWRPVPETLSLALCEQREKLQTLLYGGIE